MIRMAWADLKAIMDTMHQLKSDLERNRDRVLKTEGLVSRCRAVIEVWDSEPLDAGLPRFDNAVDPGLGVAMMEWRGRLYDELGNLKETMEDLAKRP